MAAYAAKPKEQNQMTVDELMQHIDNGTRLFVSANGRKREVRNAGRAWVEYFSPSSPHTVECVFTDEFAEWAKASCHF